MRLTKIILEDFRSFEGRHEIDVRPLTLLIGPNNAGKSNVWKGLLLLQENLRRRGGWRNIDRLDYALSKTNLISHIKTVNAKALQKYIVASEANENGLSYNKSDLQRDKFILGFELAFLDDEHIEGYRCLIELTFGKRDDDSKSALQKVVLCLNGEFLASSGIGNSAQEFNTKLFLDVFPYSPEDRRSQPDKSNIPRHNFLTYIKAVSGDPHHRYGINPLLNLSIMLHVLEERRIDKDTEELNPIFRHIVGRFDGLLNNIFGFAQNSLYFVPAYRAVQKYIYYEGDEEIFGRILAEFQRLPKRSTDGGLKDDVGIEDFLKEAFVTLKVFDGDDMPILKVSALGDTAYNRVEFEWPSGEIRTLLQLGQGITQLLPTLFLVGLSKGGVLILEEPENSLHPNFQTALAQVLFEGSGRFGVQLMLETHSEYFVRKLQVMIKGKEKGITNKDVLIHYLFSSFMKDREIARYITIDDEGYLNVPFGEGFFDEAGELIDILNNVKN